MGKTQEDPMMVIGRRLPSGWVVIVDAVHLPPVLMRKDGRCSMLRQERRVGGFDPQLKCATILIGQVEFHEAAAVHVNVEIFGVD
jgi:hypothetical protein